MAGKTCGNTGVYFGDFSQNDIGTNGVLSGLDLEIAKGDSAQFTLPKTVRMINNSEDGCQGAGALAAGHSARKAACMKPRTALAGVGLTAAALLATPVPAPAAWETGSGDAGLSARAAVLPRPGDTGGHRARLVGAGDAVVDDRLSRTRLPPDPHQHADRDTSRGGQSLRRPRYHPGVYGG